MGFNLLKWGQPLYLWRLQINMSSIPPKLLDILHNLGERWADSRIAVPTDAQEILYGWIVEA